MPPYKIYIVDRKSRAHLPAVSVACPDDDAAIEKASQAVGDGQTAEVWEGARFVIRLDPGDEEGQG